MTVTVPDTTRPDSFSRSAWALLLVLAGAVFMEGVDVSMMGVALPAIRDEMDMSTAGLQWVVSAYVLGYGGFVLLGGRAADLLGRRRMFVGWLVVFILFSGLGGLASESWMLIVARFATGVAAGFLAPAGMSIITTSFAEGPARNRALLVYAGAGAAGFSLGLVVGGLLTAIDWRWVFFAPVVGAALLLVLALRIIPDDGRPARTSGGFDLPGAFSVTGGMLLVVVGIVQAPESAPGVTVAALAGGAALLAAFVAIERRSASPLLRLGLLRSRPLVQANVGIVLFMGSFIAFQFVAVLYMQELRGWSALETGLALLIVGTDAVLAPTVTPKLIARFGVPRTIAGGVLIAAIAYALFVPLGADWAYTTMLPTLILLGIAFSLAFGALAIAATDGVPARDQGIAGGLVSMSIQLGAAIGLAIATAVNVAATDGDGPAALLDGYRAALIVPLAMAVAGVIVTLPGAVSLRTAAGREPEPECAG